MVTGALLIAASGVDVVDSAAANPVVVSYPPIARVKGDSLTPAA